MYSMKVMTEPGLNPLSAHRDDDMQSLASLMSMKHADIGNMEDFNESDEEDDRKAGRGLSQVTGMLPLLKGAFGQHRHTQAGNTCIRLLLFSHSHTAVLSTAAPTANGLSLLPFLSSAPTFAVPKASQECGPVTVTSPLVLGTPPLTLRACTLT